MARQLWFYEATTVVLCGNASGSMRLQPCRHVATTVVLWGGTRGFKRRQRWRCEATPMILWRDTGGFMWQTLGVSCHDSGSCVAQRRVVHTANPVVLCHGLQWLSAAVSVVSYHHS